VVHLLNYIIQRKCKVLDTIEHMMTVTDKYIEIKCNFTPSSVRLVPAEEPLDFIFNNGYVHVKLQQIQGHTMIYIKK
ncbi:MAG: hypothetical protein ACYDG2_09555, partial [Ruminiclostridium sp.]